MARLFTLITAFAFICLSSKSQGTYQFTNFSMGPSSGEVFTTNNFKAINAGLDGIIWAGTQYGGLYRFDTTYKTWTKSDHLTNVLINDIKPDREKGIWIAQSGLAGGGAATNIAGGINYFSNRSDGSMKFYSVQGTVTKADLWTRNVRSLFVDTSYTGPLPKVWAAQGESKSGGEAVGGGLSIGLNDNDPYFSQQREAIDVKNFSSPTCIGGDEKQVWMAVRKNFNRSQILRYNRASAFIGFYDYTNMPDMFSPGFIAQSIYFDSHGNKWICLSSGGLIIKNASGWQKVSDRSFSPDGLSFNPNAVTEDAYGNVYFGTDKGLLKFKSPRYNVSSDPTLASNYELITTTEGLVGNHVNGLAFDAGSQSLLIATSAGVSFLNLKEPYIKGVAYNVYTGLDKDSVPGYKKIPVKAVVHLIHDGEVKETVVAGEDGIFELKQAEPNKSYTVQVEYRLNPPRITYLYEDVFNHTLLKPALIPDSLIKEMKSFRDKIRRKCMSLNLPLTSIPAIPFCLSGFDTTNFSKPFSYFYNPNGITDHELRVENLANYFAAMKLVYQLGGNTTELTIETIDNLWQLFDLISGFAKFKNGLLTSLRKDLTGSALDEATEASLTALINASLNTAVGAAKMAVTYLMSDATKDPYFKKLFDAFLSTFNDACDLITEALASGDENAISNKMILDNVKKYTSIGVGVVGYSMVYTNSIHGNLITDLSNRAAVKYSKKPYQEVYNDLIAYKDTTSVMFKASDHFKWTKDAVALANKVANVAGNIAQLTHALAFVSGALGPASIGAIKAIGLTAKGVQLAGVTVGIGLDLYGINKQVDYSKESETKAGFRIRPEWRSGNGIAGIEEPVKLQNELTNFKSKLANLKAVVNSPQFSSQSYADGIYGYLTADSSYSLERTNVIMSIAAAADSAALYVPGFAEKYQRLHQVFIDSAMNLQEGLVYQATAFVLEQDKAGYASSVDSTLTQMAEMNDSIYVTIVSLINDINDNDITSRAYLYATKRVVEHTHAPASTGTVTYTLKNYGKEIMSNVSVKITEPTEEFVLITSDSLILGDLAPGQEKTVSFQFTSPADTDSITIGQYGVKVYADNGIYGDISGILYILAMSPVPVELQNFAVKCSGDQNMLSWETLSETNSSHFSIEGSVNGTDWSTRGTVYAAGNSTMPRNYNLSIKVGEDRFFRLKQVDRDGKHMFSNVVRSNCNPANNLISVYPIPVANALNVDITSEKSGTVNLILTDMTGRLVKRIRHHLNTGENKLQINTDGLANGQYILRVENPWLSRTLKITVRR